MKKLTINQQSLGKRGTTAIHLDIDTYLKIEKISILTGRRKTEIVAELVNFALEHTEVESCDDVNFSLGVNVRKPIREEPKKAEQPQVHTLVPVREAVEITGLSEYYLRQKLKTGEIPAIRSGNKWLIHIETLLDMLRDSAQGGSNGYL